MKSALIRSLKYTLATKNGKIPRPRDPTLAESFKKKLSKQQIAILMDPKGFMTEEQKQQREEKVDIKSTDRTNHQQQQKQQFTQNDQNDDDKSSKPNHKIDVEKMQPEYGYKPKGPQPTRYGDWEVKGKCVDF